MNFLRKALNIIPEWAIPCLIILAFILLFILVKIFVPVLNCTCIK